MGHQTDQFTRRLAAGTAALAIVALGSLAAVAISAPASAAKQEVPVAISVMTGAEIGEIPVMSVSDALARIPGIQTYRYGDNPGGSATLDANTLPASTPDVAGVVVLSPGTAGWESLVGTIESQATGFSSFGSGGLLRDTDYAYFIASRDQPATMSTDIATSLSFQIDFPLSYAGSDGWVAQPAFPGDTWQGGTLVFSGQQPAGQDFNAPLIDVLNGFQPIAYDGFYAWGPDWVIGAVDMPTLSSYGQLEGFAFGSHVHDGTRGLDPSSSSIIGAFPDNPRTSADLVSISLTPIVLELPEPSPSPSETASPDSSPSATPEPEDAAAQGGSWAWIWWPIGILLLAAAFVAWWAISGKPRDGATTGDGTGGVDAGGRIDPAGAAAWTAAGAAAAGMGDGVPVVGDGCEPLRLRWQEAKRHLGVRRERLEAAHEFFNDRQVRVHELEQLKADYHHALEGGSAGSGGTEFARLDGELIIVDDLKELIDHVEADLTDAIDELNRAKEDLDARLAEFEAAEADEQAARAAYEECVGATAGAEAEAAATEVTTEAEAAATGVVASAPRVISSLPRTDCGCDPATESRAKMVPVGAPFRVRLYRDFDVISQADPASQHASAEHGAEMVAGLKQVAQELDAIGDALSGGGAVSSGAKSLAGFQTGEFVKGSLQAVKGTVDGLSAADVIPPVPTSLPDAVVNGLEGAANLGALVADKVTEWMGKNEWIEVHASYYYQVVTVQPMKVWECEDGTWVCRTRVNHYVVGKLEVERGTKQGYTVKSDQERRRLRARISGLANRGKWKIQHSIEQLAEWEKANPPGDCSG